MKSGRTIEVSEAVILTACEELYEQNGRNPYKVSPHVVREKVGGGAGRVRQIVNSWREAKVGAVQAPQVTPEDTGSLPTDVATALQDMRGGLDALGRCVRDAIASALHDERRRASEAAHAAEQAAKALLDQEGVKTASAQAEAESYSAELDEAVAQAEEARAEAARLRAELAAAQETARAMTADRDRLAAEGERIRVEVERLEGVRGREVQRREQAENRRDELQQQMIAVGRQHDERLLQEQERHRTEIEAERVRSERLEARLEAKLEAQARKVEKLQDERHQFRDKVQQLEAELGRLAQKPVAEEVR